MQQCCRMPKNCWQWTVLILDECKFRSWWTVLPEMLYTTERQVQHHKCISRIVCLFGDMNYSLFTTTFSAHNRTSFSKFLCETETNVIKQNKSHYSTNLQLNNLLLKYSFHNKHLMYYGPLFHDNYMAWNFTPIMHSGPIITQTKPHDTVIKVINKLATPHILALKKSYRVKT